jgi:hypothetical protein
LSGEKAIRTVKKQTWAAQSRRIKNAKRGENIRPGHMARALSNFCGFHSTVSGRYLLGAVEGRSPPPPPAGELIGEDPPAPVVVARGGW